MLRFLKFTAVTVPMFLLDLLILVLLTKYAHMHYVLAAGIAFTIATTLNYILSRHFVFTETTRSISLGYIYFLGIAGAGLLTVTTSMWVLVGLLHFNYIASRLLIAAVEGMWNYLMNFYFNFQVDEEHQVMHQPHP